MHSYKFVTELGKAIAHTSTQAFTGLAFGQQPTTGNMAASFFGSSMGSAMEATKKVTTGMMIGMSSLAGGMGSVMAGGNFAQGAIMGGFISTVNHAMHTKGGGGGDKGVPKNHNPDNGSIKNFDPNWFEEHVMNSVFGKSNVGKWVIGTADDMFITGNPLARICNPCLANIINLLSL